MNNKSEASFFRRNGLSIVLLLLFIAFWAGQTLAGHRVHNEELLQEGGEAMDLSTYLASGHFLEATMENWESEFLQMAAYVLLTVFLFQRGSSESKKLGEPEEVDRDPRASKAKRDAPWPVRRGGWVLTLYESSLSLAFVLLFLLSLALHAVGGTRLHNEEQLLNGEPTVTVTEFLGTSQFWFESFQNWQSEFLAIACMVLFSIWLRQRGSPESKPVDAPHEETGSG